MEVFPTSKICDLPKLILEWNCIHFRDETGKLYSAEEVSKCDIYVWFEDRMHKLKVINKPLKVDSLPIVSPWYVDDFYINDKVITNSEDIRLKFFLDKSDWTDRNAFCSGLKSIKNEVIKSKLKHQYNEPTVYPKVFIDSSMLI